METDFTRKLRLAADFETRAYLPIADETLLITRKSPRNGVPQEETVLLGERMQDFVRTVREEEEILKGLWEEWEQIQLDTVCLAVEVLVLNAIAEEENNMDADVDERLKAAVKAHQEFDLAYKTIVDNSKSLEEAVKNVTNSALGKLRAQQKVSIVFHTMENFLQTSTSKHGPS